DIDPVYYDAAYYLVPDPVAAKAYALLTEAMERSEKVAIATFVMRTKQYVAAIRPKDATMVLSTMVYADEVNAAEGLDGLDAVARIEVSDKELAMAEQLITSLTEEFDATRYTDTYRERVLELIDRKASGEAPVVEAPAAPTADKVVDLMAALEASVAEAKKARSRHPSSKSSSGAVGTEADEADETDEAAEAAPKKKRSASRRSA
ncbi:MAG: Ku protein, partial [Acidimicrobiales bacterium]|nr:Ku protein [Acidimicrobiales bacterium]